MADMFMGCKEKAGVIPNTNPEKGYHHFILNIALEEMLEDTNDVSSCGFDILGLERSGFDSEGSASYKDGRKINAEDMEKIFGFPVTSAEALKPFVFKPCRVVFNRKGKISRIEFPPEVIEEINKKSEPDKKGGK